MTPPRSPTPAPIDPAARHLMRASRPLQQRTGEAHKVVTDLPKTRASNKASEMGVHISEFVHGNALDLSRFADSSFEVVLLMGPLYHLVEPSDRDRAIREALRVLQPEGILFASFISRYAVYLDLLKQDPALLARYARTYENLMDTAVHVPTEKNPGFTDAYFAHPIEIEPLMSGHTLLRAEY